METSKRRIVLAIGILTFVPIAAGTLNPPGPPAPTMVTLQQIYDKQSGPLAKTGQTTCFNGVGTTVPCTPGPCTTNQDGALAKGAAASPRFTSNPDGTVKDNLTGLIWLKLANCFGEQNWTSAMSSVQALASGSCGLSDGSAPGDWRMPNLNEQLSLIDWGQPSGAALPAGHPFIAPSVFYWSSTPFNSGNFVWRVLLTSGAASNAGRTALAAAWPVRGGR